MPGRGPYGARPAFLKIDRAAYNPRRFYTLCFSYLASVLASIVIFLLLLHISTFIKCRNNEFRISAASLWNMTGVDVEVPSFLAGMLGHCNFRSYQNSRSCLFRSSLHVPGRTVAVGGHIRYELKQ